MSLKAAGAGVALNLTGCHCACVRPKCAINRAHRLEQYRPIRAVRFVAEGTVEERVLQLQEKRGLFLTGLLAETLDPSKC
jgi:hypothetical protein